MLRYGITPKLFAERSGHPPPCSIGSRARFAARIRLSPLPWFAYGLVGFTVGVLAQRHRDFVLARRRQLVVVASVATALGVGFVLWRLGRGSTLMRWGSVNGTFFVSGYVMVAGVLAFALAAAKTDGSGRWLDLRGTSSLALVPHSLPG